MHSHGGDKIGNQLGNFETDRPRFIDDALRGGVDCLDGNFTAVPVLAMNGRGDYRRGKAGQGSDLNDATGRKNTDEGREKKVIARANSSRIPGAFPLHHRMKKLDFAGWRNFPRVSQKGREGPVLGLEFLERAKFAKIDALADRIRRRTRQRAPQFPHDFETMASRRRPKSLAITRKRKFQIRWPIL